MAAPWGVEHPATTICLDGDAAVDHRDQVAVGQAIEHSTRPGPIDAISGEAALDPLVEYYRTLQGEHPDWDDYRRAMTEDKRCLVRFHITKAGPDKHG